MNTLIAILAGLIAINFVVTLWLVVSWRRRQDSDSAAIIRNELNAFKAELVSKQMDGLVSLRDSLDSANRLLNERLAEGTTTLDRRMAVIGEIENKLGRLATQTQTIENIGRNIQSLSELLRPPKLRGNLGELLLENLLAEILPQPMFETQYKLRDGQRVDAVVKLGDHLMPIDSKFPLDAFQRLGTGDDAADRSAEREFQTAIKKHVDNISSKYLRPDEHTTDFAIMYIPSEAVYYHLVTGGDAGGFAYALTKRVIPSSPGHFYGFLASVAATYAQAGLVQSNRNLVAGLASLGESLEHLGKLNERMGGSLRQAGLALEKSREELSSMSHRLDRMRQPQFSDGDQPVE